MRTFISTMVRILIAFSIAVTSAQSQSTDMITVQFEDRFELPTKSLHIRNMRYVKLRVDAHSKQEVQYKTNITANKAGLQRNFGDGKLYFVVQNDRAILEFRPQSGQTAPVQEQSWIKALFSKSEIPGRILRVQRADVSIMAPADIDLQIDSHYTDVWVTGMRHSLSILNRYGKVNVNDHQGEVLIDQQYSDTRASKLTGDVSIQARYGKVNIESVKGNVSLSGNGMELTAEDQSGDLSVNVSYGKIRMGKVAEGGRLNLSGNYNRFDVSSSSESVVFDGKYNTANLQLQPPTAGGSLRINQSYSTVDVRLLSNVSAKYQLSNQYGSFEHNFEGGGLKKQIKSDGLSSGGPVGARYEIWVTNRYGTVKMERKINQ